MNPNMPYNSPKMPPDSIFTTFFNDAPVIDPSILDNNHNNHNNQAASIFEEYLILNRAFTTTSSNPNNQFFSIPASILHNGPRYNIDYGPHDKKPIQDVDINYLDDITDEWFLKFLMLDYGLYRQTVFFLCLGKINKGTYKGKSIYILLGDDERAYYPEGYIDARFPPAYYIIEDNANVKKLTVTDIVELESKSSESPREPDECDDPREQTPGLWDRFKSCLGCRNPKKKRFGGRRTRRAQKKRRTAKKHHKKHNVSRRHKTHRK